MFYSFARFILKLYFFIYHRMRVRGLDRLEEFLVSHDGPVVLAANHESYLDPPAIGVAFSGRLRFVAWDGLFKVPLLSSLISALGAVPVSQENKNSAAGLLRQVIGFIEDGFSVLIFPEGMRSPDGALLPFEGGAAFVASKTNTPIVPVWMEGTWEAMSVHVTIPRPHGITVTFGDPILPGELPEKLSEKERRGALLDALRSSLENMRGVNYRRRVRGPFGVKMRKNGRNWKSCRNSTQPSMRKTRGVPRA
ncbi:MAG: 1-acyl-sn-glycerol-3-phosphate acyltransferase [Synergistaceae bacterium]|jgi:1-acyl-sn-glycerol-3-phosphate acyltransferase|nr:1-acyl-sn-glycerol-3-phosphate acyltransferase [Synergistaceae bacterium]